LGQAPFVRSDAAGVEHWIDVHWAVSVAKPFADALSWPELLDGAAPVPSLGSHARTPGLPHALLLACIHPVMHHRNAERLMWICDVDRLARRLDAGEWSAFVSMVRTKRLRAVATRGLTLATERLGTVVPPDVLAAIAPEGEAEATAAYLEEGRGWLD